MIDDHVALIVEDDPLIAEVLKEFIRALGHTYRHAVTLADVRREIAVGGYCYVLLDMQIPTETGSAPHVGAGETALRLLRKRDTARNATGFHVLPIVVVTAYSREPDFVSKMYDEGASGFINKPFGNGGPQILDKLRTILGRAGRAEHELCASFEGMAGGAAGALNTLVLPATPSAMAPIPAVRVQLSVPGAFGRKRTLVRVNEADCNLQDGPFAFLLQLMVSHRANKGTWEEARALGIARSPVVPSRVRAALLQLLPAPLDIIENDRGGRFRLHGDVVIGEIAWGLLSSHPNARVKGLAERATAAKKR